MSDSQFSTSCHCQFVSYIIFNCLHFSQFPFNFLIKDTYMFVFSIYFPDVSICFSLNFPPQKKNNSPLSSSLTPAFQRIRWLKQLRQNPGVFRSFRGLTEVIWKRSTKRNIVPGSTKHTTERLQQKNICHFAWSTWWFKIWVWTWLPSDSGVLKHSSFRI